MVLFFLIKKERQLRKEMQYVNGIRLTELLFLSLEEKLSLTI